jgi:cholest-4-en-3-one 26-monooxygenase
MTAVDTRPDIYSPERYRDGPPHDVFARLRRTDPVYWQEIPGQAGYWAVLKHADVAHVARHPEIFSASEGGVMLEDAGPESLARQRQMLLAMDPPQHRVYRQPLVPHFSQRVVAGIETQIREVCKNVLAGVADRQGSVDFVREVASHVPTRIIGSLFGLPEDEWERLHRLAELANRGQDAESDPETARDLERYGDPSAAIAMQGYQHAARRRSEVKAGAPPAEDLTSVILFGDFAGHRFTDADFGGFFVQLFVAGNDTTQTMLSSGVHALLRHPEQLAQLRAEPSLIPGAVEEILRWANPLHYFRRTALVDTELRDQRIRAGDKVAMYYTSANRDEAVFDAPDQFDVTRTPNRHLSFGIAEHFCLGVHLARLEGRVFFEELLSAFPTIESAAEPRRVRSNLNNALNSLPVHFASS